MSQLLEDVLEVTNSPVAGHAIALLSNYSFDLGHYAPEQLVGYWASTYPLNWVRLAVIESLYQGRYKAVSVEQILAFWQRRGRPLYHFGNDFERIICSRFSGTDWETELAPEDQGKPLAYSVRQSQPHKAAGSYATGTGSPRLNTPRIEPWHTPTAIGKPLPRRLPAPTLERQLSSLSHPPAGTVSLPLGTTTDASATREVAHAPIHQFVPNQSSSDLDQKLRAAAQMREEFSRIGTTLAALRSRVSVPNRDASNE
ncbi:hypothetical protein [Trichothermofontia sp.]